MLTPEPLPGPPVPIDADFTLGGVPPITGELRVRFDQQLQLGTTDRDNWFVRDAIPNRHRGAGDGTVIGDTVRVPMEIAPPHLGLDETHDYAAAPPDLMNQFGERVVAYTDFPTPAI